jgi:hypothetical protein
MQEGTMEVKVKRTIFSDKTSIGQFYIEGQYFCFTLEDKTRAQDEPKVYGETAIPYGRYEITFRTTGSIYNEYKIRFADIGSERGTLWIRNIPGFEYVLMHIGNTNADTLGCILVGTQYEENKITNSTVAYKKIYPIIADALSKGEKVFITVEGITHE